MTGMVFDIQRFALHDGPGIRTTVFLKGCPLRCLWCHNPESISPNRQIAFHPERCDGDEAAAEAQRRFVDDVRAKDHTLNFSTSDLGDSVDTCAHPSIEIVGREMTVQEVMFEVTRDVAYYRRSGGGVTLSGGEPLYQPRFAGALLAAAREAGIHTCIDTSGQVSQRRLAAIAPDTDLFLFDYKATDPEDHRRTTGVSNELILENLDFLYHLGARIVLRCPLVPGVNDSRQHLEGIAALSDRYPKLQDLQILPFHDMGREKYAQIGAINPLPNLHTADAVTKNAWISALHRLGCTRARLA